MQKASSPLPSRARSSRVSNSPQRKQFRTKFRLTANTRAQKRRKPRKVLGALPRTIYLTELEQKVVKGLIEGQSYKEAARLTMMKEGTIRATTFRIRLRYFKALGYVEKCREIQRLLPRNKRYITG